MISALRDLVGSGGGAGGGVISGPGSTGWNLRWIGETQDEQFLGYTCDIQRQPFISYLVVQRIYVEPVTTSAFLLSISPNSCWQVYSFYFN